MSKQQDNHKEKQLNQSQIPLKPSQLSLNVDALLKYIGISKISYKTSKCKHEKGCLTCIITTALRGFAFGYLSRTVICIIRALLQIRKVKSGSILIQALLNIDSFKFGLMPAIYNSGMQSILCLLRRTPLPPKMTSFLSGFLAGAVSLTLINKKDRSLWSSLCMSRAIDCLFQAMCNRKKITNPSLVQTLAICFLCGGLTFFYSHEPECVTSSFYKFFFTFAYEHENDLVFRKCWQEKYNMQLAKKGIKPHDPQKMIFSFVRKQKIQ